MRMSVDLGTAGGPEEEKPHRRTARYPLASQRRSARKLSAVEMDLNQALANRPNSGLRTIGDTDLT